MPTQLIPFEQRQVGSESIQTINARDLHAFLGIAKDYTSWIKAQIKRAQFIEHEDFEVFTQKGENLLGGRPAQEYFLTFEAAKHLSMLSGTSKGKEARHYFLDCEKQLFAQQAKPTLPTFHNPQTKMLIETLMRIDVLEAEQSVQKDVIIANHVETIKAQEMALTALRSMQWVTIRQYVYMYDLGAQMPLSVQKAYAHHLGDYSRTQGIPMYKAATADVVWPDERTYHLQAIHDTLGPWLHRQSGQVVFLVPGQD